ncbi:membrane protein [Lentibacillus populi]|uniref:Membrane protein n=2 Tax=Bacillales TaxID=1385 RepID=A0A9W5U0C1_9BACI|nr:membrane protein [Lentibacillus populi]
MEGGDVKTADLPGLIPYTYGKMQHRHTYQFILFILGLPVYLYVFVIYLFRKKNDAYFSIREEIKQSLLSSEYSERMKLEFKDELVQKRKFFNTDISEKQIDNQVEKWTAEYFDKTLAEKTTKKLKEQGRERVTFAGTFQQLLLKRLFLYLSFIPGLLMYSFILLYSNPYIKYLVERLFMTIFVVVGVVFFVFTILYLSPFDPAANILGETATKDQIAAFNHLHGLDQPYFIQLWEAMKGIATFDLGLSFEGKEDVAASIANRFPVTFKLTVISLIMAVLVAIPIGIISAMKRNSFLDYTFMFIALIGLSIPNFWQGLLFILGFSIKLKWLPATFNPESWLSMIMPVIVLGTALTASVARMTRSSMLEVINEDYIITAKSKGLSQSQVLRKHAIGNAMIPIITVIGLLFGGMLGGAAVTEKVFNISGIGSYIVDKQFIPDIPAIMGGVVYVAITISLVNVIIDIMYAFFDPRIRSKMKQY